MRPRSRWAAIASWRRKGNPWCRPAWITECDGKSLSVSLPVTRLCGHGSPYQYGHPPQLDHALLRGIEPMAVLWRGPAPGLVAMFTATTTKR